MGNYYRHAEIRFHALGLLKTFCKKKSIEAGVIKRKEFVKIDLRIWRRYVTHVVVTCRAGQLKKEEKKQKKLDKGQKKIFQCCFDSIHL